MSAVHHRSKLSASQSAGHALIRKRHEEKLAVLRRRVEDDPGCGQASLLSKVEHKLHAGDLIGAGNAMVEVELALSARADHLATSASIAQTVILAEARSEIIETAPQGRTSSVRVLSRDGLLWLKAKKRLPASEMLALERYRELFDKAHAGPTADSTHAVERGPPSGGKADDGADLKRVDAIWALDQARDAVGRDFGLVLLLDEVAGKGSTLRDLAGGDERRAGRLEAELSVGARMLAKRFGLRG